MHGTGVIRGAVAVVVAAVWVVAGCGRTDVAGQAPTGIAAPTVPTYAPLPTTTVPPVRPAVASRAVIARITPPRPVPPPGAPDPGASVWDRLASCESGGNWADRDSPTYRGGLQFSYSTWRSVGGTGDPADASKAEQIQRAEALQARSGWGQWPACSRRLGLR